MMLARGAALFGVLGLALLFFGFVIDPPWPAQDATPAMIRRHAEAAERAAWVYRAGGIVLCMACALPAFTRAVGRN